MRMHQPLHLQRKVITDDNVTDKSFLPPLDAGSSRSSFSAISSVRFLPYACSKLSVWLMLLWCLCVDVQNGRGVVGWKAPPKPARETVVRQPTQGQSDAAKRLSQGLSVANVNHSARQRYIAQNHLNLPGALASTGYSVVLDPYEYQPQPLAPQGYIPPSTAAGAGQGTGQSQPTASGGAVPAVANLGAPYVPVYGGVFPTVGTDAKPEGLWPSTKANRYISMTSHSGLLLLFIKIPCRYAGC
jgi:hypothetical protein